MTRRQAKQYACAWIAADLACHEDATFHDDPATHEKVLAALREVIEEMLRRGGPYVDEPRLGPFRAGCHGNAGGQEQAAADWSARR